MYKLHLILKYLLKRRIAWVSIAAVMLCTTMVLVVISVMGGWLDMFRSSFRGLSGDLVVHTDSMRGFRYYNQIIGEIKRDPRCQVQAAIPSIETYGLFNYGYGPKPVRVIGLPMATVGTVNQFPQSLYLQRTALEEKRGDPKLSAGERAAIERQLAQPPTFDLHDEVFVFVDALPPGLRYAAAAEGHQLRAGTIALPDDFPPALKGRLRYDELRQRLIFRGRMEPSWKKLLAALSPAPAFAGEIDALFSGSLKADLVPYELFTRSKARGLIVGVGVVGIRRDKKGNWDRPGSIEWEKPCTLTVLDLSNDNPDASNQVKRNYFIVDDSHIGVWQYDSQCVYVDFESLQKDLGMDAQAVTIDGVASEVPASVTDIHIKVKPAIDPNDERQLIGIKGAVQEIVDRVTGQQGVDHKGLLRAGEANVETWQDTQRIYISAVENEKLLMVFLFGIISVVAIFLIFCIFYMIVIEKTRDIGIIKSVGATSSGVAGIFLGYGLVIGLVGALMGLGLSYLIVHFINDIHQAIGQLFGIQIWNPEVYQFDHIPNQMHYQDVLWIVPTAILSSVIGALVPAIRAAGMNPVEALRWE